MIENVYVTLKLKFKSCVLFILSNIWRMESDICRLPSLEESKGTLEQILEGRG